MIRRKRDEKHSFRRMMEMHVKANHKRKIATATSSRRRRRSVKTKIAATTDHCNEDILTDQAGYGDFAAFNCCRCRGSCSRGDHGSQEVRQFWDSISSGSGVVELDCPLCRGRIVQCCQCPHNINPDDPSLIASLQRERRTAVGHMRLQHLKYHHPGVLGVRKDDTDAYETSGDCFMEDSTNDHIAQSSEQCHFNDIDEDEDSDSDASEAMHDPEAILADEYVNLFTDLNLDPIEEVTDDSAQQHPVMLDPNVGKGTKELSYDDFSIFDFREESEKTFKNSTRQRLCQNQIYMWQSYLRDGGGFEGLLARSNARNREDGTIMAKPEEASVMFLLFKMVMDMTETQQATFAQYQKKLFKLIRIEEVSNHEISTNFPTDVNAIRCAITRGANSILKNFPAPRVFTKDEHACVGLKESVLLLLGHGGKPNFGKEDDGERNMEGLNGTKAMKDLIDDVENAWKDKDVPKEKQKKTKIGWLLFWSDSFLRCFIKQKDNSVWILTVTVCPPESEKSAGRYTIILAIGKSSTDHSKVVEHFINEANEMMEGFDCYFGSSKTMGRAAFSVLAYNADRPEMQALTLTMKEGTYGKVTGWAVSPSEEFLPACTKCYVDHIQRMVAEDFSVPASTCNSCCDWSFETNPMRTGADGSLLPLQHSDPAPDKYPATYPKEADVPVGVEVPPMPEGRTAGLKHLSPIKQSTSWMLQAVRSGYFGVRIGKWSSATAKDYLRTCNINAALTKKIVDAAIADKENEIINPSGVDPLFWKLLQCFGDRFIYPVLPMHGIAHGMIPDVLEIILQIFSKYHKKKSFYEYANPIIETVAKMRVEYCKVKTLPKAAWVSEHSLGFMRLMPYLFGTYLLNNPLGESPEAKTTTLYIKSMLNSFQAYVSILMMDDVPDHTNAIDSHAKLFMSSAHYLHKTHGILDTGKKTTTTTNPSSESTSTGHKWIEKQPLDVLQYIAGELGVEQRGGRDTILRNIRNPNKGVLLQVLGMSETEGSSYTKDKLYEKIHQELELGTEDDTDGVAANSAPKKRKKEKRCWNAGYWLSYMARISGQIAYLGHLRLIW